MTTSAPEGRRSLSPIALRPRRLAGTAGALARWPVLRRQGLLPGRGLLCVLLLIVAAMIVLGLREPMVRRIPAMAVVFEAAGLPVNLAGLALRGVHARVVADGNRKVLVTEGEIVNIRRDENHVPPLALAVRGANGLPRYAWTAPAPKTTLAPGEAVTFRARLAAPPEEGVDVLVRFERVASLPADPIVPGSLRVDRGADIPNPGKMP